MYRITFTLDLGLNDQTLARETLRTLLRGLFWVDVLYLRAHPETPPISSLTLAIQDAAGNGKTAVDWNDVPSSVTKRVLAPEAAAAWRGAEAFVRQRVDPRPNLDAFADSRPLPKRVTYVIDLFKGDEDRPLSHAVLQTLLHTLFWVDVLYLRAHPETPLLYSSGVRYEEEPIGQEDWQDVASTLRLKIGDCLPASTAVLKDDYSLVPIISLAPGDRIMGDGGWTTVVDHGVTGVKPILAFDLDNGCTLRCSPDHRLFLRDGTEVRAEDVKVGQRLRSPSEPFPTSETSSFLHDSRISDEDLAWLVGTYIADGWHGKSPNHRVCISGDDNNPKRRKGEQKVRAKRIGESINAGIYWHRKHVSLCDKTLHTLAVRCGSHAPIKRVPEMRLTREQVVSMLEGLQTDCSTANSGTLTHGTTSPELAMQLRVLYRMLGQSVHIRRWEAHEHRGLGENAMYRVTVRRHAVDGTSKAWQTRAATLADSAVVQAIRAEEPEICCDITTDSGRFYLPESDVVVHNCEDLACWRAAEIYVRWGVEARPTFIWKLRANGGYLYHIQVRYPDGRIEDPSRALGMR